jgi:hypothetical protein
MRKFFAILALLLIVLSFSATSEAVLINYDGTGFGLVSNQTFESILNYYAGLAGNPVHSGLNWIDYQGGSSSVYGPHSPTAMAFNLDSQASSISWGQDVNQVDLWYGYNSLYTNLSIQGYNDGVLVFDSGNLAQNSNGMFQYTAPDSSIDQLVFTGAANYWTLDDLSYELANSVVPEPMSLALFGSGMIALRRLSRKKKG